MNQKNQDNHRNYNNHTHHNNLKAQKNQEEENMQEVVEKHYLLKSMGVGMGKPLSLRAFMQANSLVAEMRERQSQFMFFLFLWQSLFSLTFLKQVLPKRCSFRHICNNNVAIGVCLELLGVVYSLYCGDLCLVCTVYCGEIFVCILHTWCFLWTSCF